MLQRSKGSVAGTSSSQAQGTIADLSPEPRMELPTVIGVITGQSRGSRKIDVLVLTVVSQSMCNADAPWLGTNSVQWKTLCNAAHVYVPPQQAAEPVKLLKARITVGAKQAAPARALPITAPTIGDP